ncbi:sulfatase-like protein [Ancylobacter aquaticus]|uniref:Sulfatase-like protein n=1 Tax=Ancylobacter aquaticus TaxID=100 RepID=A0A4R1IAZ2_ANCAQ|nr:sulfatase-like protein [Ancylobacter aquaticus]
MLDAILMFAAVTVTLVGAGGLDRLAVPPRDRAPRRPWQAHALGALIAGWLWLLWLGLSARPLFATVAALVTLGVFAGISRAKYAYLHEPLVFSDLGFIPTLVRHPALFYLGRTEAAGLGFVMLLLVGVIAAWTWLEPRALGEAAQFGVLAAAGLAALVVPLLAGRIAGALPGLSRHLLDLPARRFVGLQGLSVSLLAGFALWRKDGQREETRPAPAVQASGYDAVIFLQSESFTDLRRSGVALDLPHYDRLRARAMAHGRLEVSCYGAYTHRSEAEMLTGVAFADQRMDRFDPYLRPERLAPASLACGLGALGWRTCFLHPHDARFFRRDRAIPRLGFAHFVDETAFVPGDRFGPYVGDAAVGRRIVQEIEAAGAAGKALFLMAITMEAHDPYGPGRLPGLDDPVAQYARHVANADAMLGAVVAALDARTNRSLLVFYGDHAPILPGHEGLAEDQATDYLVLDCGRAATNASERPASERSPAAINALLRSKLAEGRQGDEGAGMAGESATTSMIRSTMEK